MLATDYKHKSKKRPKNGDNPNALYLYCRGFPFPITPGRNKFGYGYGYRTFDRDFRLLWVIADLLYKTTHPGTYSWLEQWNCK